MTHLNINICICKRREVKLKTKANISLLMNAGHSLRETEEQRHWGTLSLRLCMTLKRLQSFVCRALCGKGRRPSSAGVKGAARTEAQADHRTIA